jgi:hypothetical protein
VIRIITEAARQRRARRAEADRRAAPTGSAAWYAADERLRQLLGAPSAADGRQALHLIMTGQQDAHYRQYGA